MLRRGDRLNQLRGHSANRPLLFFEVAQRCPVDRGRTIASREVDPQMLRVSQTGTLSSLCGRSARPGRAGCRFSRFLRADKLLILRK